MATPQRHPGHRIRFGCPDPNGYDEPADGGHSVSRSVPYCVRRYVERIGFRRFEAGSLLDSWCDLRGHGRHRPIPDQHLLSQCLRLSLSSMRWLTTSDPQPKSLNKDPAMRTFELRQYTLRGKEALDIS